jgi:hypothetical protein
MKTIHRYSFKRSRLISFSETIPPSLFNTAAVCSLLSGTDHSTSVAAICVVVAPTALLCIVFIQPRTRLWLVGLAQVCDWSACLVPAGIVLCGRGARPYLQSKWNMNSGDFSGSLARIRLCQSYICQQCIVMLSNYHMVSYYLSKVKSIALTSCQHYQPKFISRGNAEKK